MELNLICHLHCIGEFIIDYDLLCNWVGRHLYLATDNKILTNLLNAMLSLNPYLLVSLTLHMCRRFDPGGSLDRRVKLSLRVPAQMGRREMEHKGGEPRLVLSCAQGGCACSRGYKRSRGRERERACSSARPPARPPSHMRALDLPFIDARRGSRCTTGV